MLHSYFFPVCAVLTQGINELLIMLFRPIVSFFGIKILVVEGTIMTTDLRPRESQSHRLSIGFVIDLPALRHDKMCQFIYSLFLIDLIKTINLVLIKINKKNSNYNQGSMHDQAFWYDLNPWNIIYAACFAVFYVVASS